MQLGPQRRVRLGWIGGSRGTGQRQRPRLAGTDRRARLVDRDDGSALAARARPARCAGAARAGPLDPHVDGEPRPDSETHGPLVLGRESAVRLDLPQTQEVRRVSDEAGLVEAKLRADPVAIRVAGATVVEVAPGGDRDRASDGAPVRVEVVLRRGVLVPDGEVQVPVAVDVGPGDPVRAPQPELGLEEKPAGAVVDPEQVLRGSREVAVPLREIEIAVEVEVGPGEGVRVPIPNCGTPVKVAVPLFT